MVRGQGSPKGMAVIEHHFGPVSRELRLSEARFPDGAHLRFEIPSVEGPEALRAVLDEARVRKVSIHRTSQGSGSMLLSEAELSLMAKMGAEEGIEVCLFVGPREEFGIGASVRSPEGVVLSGQLRGFDQLRFAVEDVLRAAEAGIRSFLVADTGLLEVLTAMVHNGELPDNIVWKMSSVRSPSNAISFRQLVRLGATTINVPSDSSVFELCDIRTLNTAPIDLYIEAPDSLGGMVRGHEIAEIAAVGAPLYAKFGLRNARPVYPAGQQLHKNVIDNVREKVRRAALSLEWLERSSLGLVISEPGAKDLGIPEP